MNIKIISKATISKRNIVIIFMLLILYALMCLGLNNQTTSAEEFLIKFYQQLNIFFIHVPLILILIISSYRKLHNELIIIRFKSEMKLFKAELITAALIAIIYNLLTVSVEIIFVFITSGIPDPSFIFSFLISVCIQILTVFFAAALYIMLKKISKKDIVSIIIMLFIFGIDAYTTIVRTPVFPNSFNIFISPMCCLAEYILYPKDINYFYYLSISVMKISITVLITYLSIWVARRDYLAQK